MTSREPVKNKIIKQRNNYALECGLKWTSCIYINWTAGVTAVKLLRAMTLFAESAKELESMQTQLGVPYDNWFQH